MGRLTSRPTKPVTVDQVGSDLEDISAKFTKLGRRARALHAVSSGRHARELFFLLLAQTTFFTLCRRNADAPSAPFRARQSHVTRVHPCANVTLPIEGRSGSEGRDKPGETATHV